MKAATLLNRVAGWVAWPDGDGNGKATRWRNDDRPNDVDAMQGTSLNDNEDDNDPTGSDGMMAGPAETADDAMKLLYWIVLAD